MNILTVSQLNRYISFKLKEDKKLNGIFIKGEISNFKNAGHMYFTIKDNDSLIKAVMFKSNASSLKFQPENGMNIIAMGTVSVFERDGVYQLYVSDMQPDGIGDRHFMFEKLKAELMGQGLFEQSHKLPVPEFPHKVGVVTSQKGAALQDIINIITRRYPICELAVYHSSVQGDAAPKELCEALDKAQNDSCDVIILGRGGGSYEDLEAFNDKTLAYFIYNMTVPVISAVGHETDFTIADFVSDLRAPTPSAAAELAVPSAELLIRRTMDLEDRIKNALEMNVHRKNNRFSILLSRLYILSPQALLEKSRSSLELKVKRLDSAYDKLISYKESSLTEKISRLNALNPLDVLSRGYSVIYKNDTKIVKSVNQLSKGDKVRLRLSDGSVYAEISETEK